MQLKERVSIIILIYTSINRFRMSSVKEQYHIMKPSGLCNAYLIRLVPMSQLRRTFRNIFFATLLIFCLCWREAECIIMYLPNTYYKRRHSYMIHLIISLFLNQKFYFPCCVLANNINTCIFKCRANRIYKDRELRALVYFYNINIECKCRYLSQKYAKMIF